MKYLIALLGLAFATPSFAATYLCRASKSLLQYTPETGEIKTQTAETSLFKVTEEEHEETRNLDFIQKDGSPWGQVLVSTGTQKTELGETFYANAMITDSAGTIQAYLMLNMPKNSSSASASTMILGEELPPTMTLSCFSAVE